MHLVCQLLAITARRFVGQAESADTLVDYFPARNVFRDKRNNPSDFSFAIPRFNSNESSFHLRPYFYRLVLPTFVHCFFYPLPPSLFFNEKVIPHSASLETPSPPTPFVSPPAYHGIIHFVPVAKVSMFRIVIIKIRRRELKTNDVSSRTIVHFLNQELKLE